MQKREGNRFELEESQRKPKKVKKRSNAARRESRRKTGEELEWQ